jgi:predicted TIM-barrel fold metal-dependent hydrolase
MPHNLYDQAADTVENIRLFRKLRPESKILMRPFMGLNTRHRSPDEISTLLDTCFSPGKGWSPYGIDAERSWKKLAKAKQGRRFRDIPHNTFGGVKVYPPLGFDPWPDNPAERVKVEILYRFCEKHGVPVTTHCDDQGFRLIPQEDSMRRTSPARWEAALDRFPELYLNFAHFGKQYYKGLLFKQNIVWQEKIVELLIRYPHVYSDISFSGVSPDTWKDLQKLLETMKPREADRVSSKLLFGTDWPLSLWLSESASSCWRTFFESCPDTVLQDKMLSANPMEFHFR